MADVLRVWLGATEVGTLTRTRNGARFQYAGDVVAAGPGRPLLSTSLPVQAEPFEPGQTAAWFTGLLPEDRQREEVERRFGLQGATYFDMLREIGWECAGAVTISAEAQPPDGALRRLSDSHLAERLAALPSHPHDDNRALRMSIGGYQAKLLATADDDGWALPLDGAVSTHILKPQPHDRYPGLVAAEAWAMTAAADATAVAEVELLHIPGAPETIAVTRFDRTRDHGALVRLHQEDAAQAMGIPPERKYASSGRVSRSDPSLARLATLLDRYASDPFAEQQRLLQQVVVNVAMGNTDAHAKNYGLLHRQPGQVTLTPMYDIVPALFLNPAMLEMGLRIDGVLRIDRVSRERVANEALSWGLPSATVEQGIEDTLARLLAGVDAACARFPDGPSGLAAFVRRRIEAIEA